MIYGFLGDSWVTECTHKFNLGEENEIERLKEYRENVLGKHLRQAVKKKERKPRDMEGGNEGRFESKRGGRVQKKTSMSCAQCKETNRKAGKKE